MTALLSRRVFILGVAAASALAALPAFARENAAFDPAAFDAAVRSGKPVLIHIGAPWCPICRAQKPIISKLLDDPRFADFTPFEIDFDTDKADVRLVGAQLQSTLIVYGGGREIARSVGEAQAEWIEDLLEKAVPAKAAG